MELVKRCVIITMSKGNIKKAVRPQPRNTNRRQSKKKGSPIITRAKVKTMKNQILEKIESRKAKSAWDKGVLLYAFELVENLEEETFPASKSKLEELLLNGANSWSQYSWGGGALIYDFDIAQRLCTPSELKRKRGGELAPNSHEQWLDVQARALAQAANLICSLNK